MFLALNVWAADLGFNDISSSKIETMTYVWPEVVVSTGTETMILIVNPLWNVNAGTTYYYYLGANSKMVCDASKTSIMINQGK